MGNSSLSVILHSVVKVQIVVCKAQALFLATHTVYHIHPAFVNGGLKSFFIFLKVVTVAGFEPASHALKVRCRTTLLHRVEIVKTPDSRPLIHCILRGRLV